MLKRQSRSSKALTQLNGRASPSRRRPSYGSKTAATLKKLETATLKQYRNHIRLHIVPKIGGIRLAQLSAPIVDDFKDRLLAANSRVMTGKVLTSLRSILAHAQAKGRVGHNAAAAVRLGAKQRRESGRLEIGRDIPAKDEVRRILDAVHGTRWHPILATAAMAGLRSSELRGLRWNDLDLDVGILRVRRRADETGNMGSPKSAAGARDIPMSPWLVNVLKRWRLECPRAKGVLDLVFPNGKGHVENHANIANRGLYATERKLGILDAAGSPRYGMHSLRHFFASLMIEQNHLPKRVQEMLGHSSLQMTYDRYGDLFPAGDGERTKMEQASAFLAATKSV